MKKLGLCLLVIAGLSGCSTTYLPDLDSSTAGSGSNTAGANQLMQEADTLNRQGKHALAREKLERALRLEKQNPYIWFSLAKTHEMEGNSGQAKNFALRAKSLSNNAQLTRNIDSFINSL